MRAKAECDHCGDECWDDQVFCSDCEHFFQTVPMTDTHKPESREPANSQLKESEPELKPQAAADSFDEDFFAWFKTNYPETFKISSKSERAALVAMARWGHSRGVARMQSEIANWKQLHDNNEACINNQYDRISALERERDELKAANDLVWKKNSELRSALLKASRYLHHMSGKDAEVISEALKRIGGGK